MSSRRKARKRALDVLYASDVRGVDLAELIDQEQARAMEQPEKTASWEFAKLILTGVRDHGEGVDQTITEKSSWPLDRMPAVDRAIARLATWEIIYQPDIPTAVIISEAGELASEYSTEESRSFIQGLLGAIASERRATP